MRRWFMTICRVTALGCLCGALELTNKQLSALNTDHIDYVYD